MPSLAFACAVLTSTMVTVILGLDQVLRRLDPESPTRAWKSCSVATRGKFLLLVLYFFAFLPAILVLICAWLVNKSDLDLQLLLELSLLNGLSVEAVFLWRTFSIPRELRITLILVPTLAAIAGSLLVVSLGVSFYNNTIWRYVAFAGGRLFHVSAATVFLYILRFKIARRQKLKCFFVTYAFAALSGFLFLLIINGHMFLLANCILGCLVNFILLAFAQIEWHKKGDGTIVASLRDEEGDGDIAASLRDEGSVSARSSLKSCNPDTEEANAGNAGGDPLRIEVERTVTVYHERHGLRTPPPSPPLIQGGVRYASTTTDATNNQHITPSSLDTQSPLSTPPLFTCPSDIQLQGFESFQIHPFESTASPRGISVQVIALDPRKGGRLRLVDMDWKTLSLEETIQVKKYIGDIAYNNVSEHYSRYQSRKDHCQDYKLILWAGHDLFEWIPSFENRRALLDGFEIGAEALETSVAKV